MRLDGQQLLGEERVPAGQREDPVGEPAVGGRAEHAGQQGLQLHPVELAQLDPLGRAYPVEVGQPGQHRVGRGQLVGPAGQHEQQPEAGGRADQHGQQVAGGPVGPVHVLDGEDHRGPRTHPLHDGEQGEEHRSGLAAGGHGQVPGPSVRHAQLGYQAGQCGGVLAQQVGQLSGAGAAGQPAQRLRDRGVRQLAPGQRRAAAEQDGRAGTARRVEEGGQAAGLAHASVAEQHRQRCLHAGDDVVKTVPQLRHLGRTADELGGDHPCHQYIPTPVGVRGRADGWVKISSRITTMADPPADPCS